MTREQIAQSKNEFDAKIAANKLDYDTKIAKTFVLIDGALDTKLAQN